MTDPAPLRAPAAFLSLPRAAQLALLARIRVAREQRLAVAEEVRWRKKLPGTVTGLVRDLMEHVPEGERAKALEELLAIVAAPAAPPAPNTEEPIAGSQEESSQ